MRDDVRATGRGAGGGGAANHFVESRVAPERCFLNCSAPASGSALSSASNTPTPSQIRAHLKYVCIASHIPNKYIASHIPNIYIYIYIYSFPYT